MSADVSLSNIRAAIAAGDHELATRLFADLDHGLAAGVALPVDWLPAAHALLAGQRGSEQATRYVAMKRKAGAFAPRGAAQCTRCGALRGYVHERSCPNGPGVVWDRTD
jgi:hypothetical protein